MSEHQVVVITEARGLTSTEVEQRVTYPIETALMGVPNTEQVRSLSKFELSMITVVFDDAVPIYLARQLVNERLNEARSRIPDGPIWFSVYKVLRLTGSRSTPLSSCPAKAT